MLLKKNQRVMITIDPWGITAADGSELSESFTGQWNTPLDPMYSHPHLLVAIGGKIVEQMPSMLLNIAIFDASRYVLKMATATCPNPDGAYFCAVRNRYVTLRALLSLYDGYLGPALVKRKLLGDFEIEYEYRDGDSNLLSRYLDELKKLEPAVMNKGCLGIGTDHGMLGVTKGAWDPYRPVLGRGSELPPLGSPHPVYGYYSPGYESVESRFANRYHKAGETRFPRQSTRRR